MILSIGMMVCDTLLSPIPQNVLELDCIEINKSIQFLGGDALNVAQALQKLGSDTAIAGRVGNDSNGQFILNQCKDLSINCECVKIDHSMPTASTFILGEENGERHFLSNIEIFDRLSAEDVPGWLIDEADVIYFGSICSMSKMDRGGIESIFEQGKNKGKITVMDAAMNPRNTSDNWMETIKTTLRYTDYFFPSMEEARRITREDDIFSIAEYFKDTGLKGFGVKLGGQGSFLTDFERYEFIKAPEVKVVDTTGAGDTFMAGLVAGLYHEMDFFESALFASSVAATSVEHRGGTAGVEIFEKELIKYHNRSIGFYEK